MPNPLAIRKQDIDPDAARINTLHNFGTEGGFAVIKTMISCGRILTRKKANVGHGQWLRWVKANLEFSARTAQFYLRLYEHREQILRERPESLVMALALLADTRRVTPGPIASDKAILPKNLLLPLNTLRTTLK